jgi:phage protein D
MPTPVFYISADGVDVTGRLMAGGLLSMTITDGIGINSDTLQIEIDDVNGIVAAPSTGTVLNPRGGYLDGEIRDFGQFIVDQVTLSGYPQKIQIDAQSVAATSTAKQHRPKDYRKEEYPTYADIFRDVAGRAGLSLSIASEIGSIEVEYEAQGEESEVGFATRIGRSLDATVTIKNNQLVVVANGSGLSTSGQQMPTIPVAPGRNLVDYSVSWRDKPKYSKVKATWYDRKKNKPVEVEAETGMDGPEHLIREPFQDEAEATRAAKTKAKRLKREQATASFTIDGLPSASAGAFVVCSGVRPNVDGAWYAKTVTHTFSSDSAYSTKVECEVPTSGASKPAKKGSSSGAGGGGGSGNGSGSGSSSATTPATEPPIKPWSQIDQA